MPRESRARRSQFGLRAPGNGEKMGSPARGGVWSAEKVCGRPDSTRAAALFSGGGMKIEDVNRRVKTLESKVRTLERKLKVVSGKVARMDSSNNNERLLKALFRQGKRLPFGA